jgi:hypothetical protein
MFGLTLYLMDLLQQIGIVTLVAPLGNLIPNEANIIYTTF